VTTAEKARRLVEAYEGMAAWFPGLARGNDAVSDAVEVGRGYLELLAAAKTVLAGLDRHIRHAKSETPVFEGIAALHDAIKKAEGGAP
jgi:hypothetical protein